MYRQRPFREEDWPALAAFAGRRFGSTHLADRGFNEHWFKTPWHGQWAVRLLEDERGGLAGAMCAIVVRAKFGGATAPLAWISSAAVEDEARARGAGAQLYFWVYKSFPLVGAMSGNENSLPINSVLGRDIPGVGMRRFVAVHDRRAGELARSGGADAVLARVSRPAGAACAEAESVAADYPELWGRVRERYAFTTERDAGHLAWRYRRAPFVRYRLLELRSAGRLRAWAAARLQETPAGPVCRVLDFVADREASAEAWRAAAAWAAAQGAVFTDFMVIGSDQDEALAEAGFLPADAATGLDALPHLLSPVEHRSWSNTFHAGGALALADQSWRRPGAVYFTKGDSDRDWPTTYELERRKAIGRA